MMMMISSAVNKQNNLPQLSAMGNAKAPKEAHKQEAGASPSPKLDLVDAREDSFELSASPREAVAEAPSDTLSLSTTSPAVAPPAPAKPSILAIGATVLATIGIGLGGFALAEKGKLAEEVKGLTSKLDVAEKAKTLAQTAETLAKEAKTAAEAVGTKLDNTNSEVNQFVQRGNAVLTDIGAFIMQSIEQKPSDKLTRMDINILLHASTDIHRVARVFEGLGNLQKAEVDQVFPQVLGQVSNLVNHTDVTGHPDRLVVGQGNRIQALLEVLEKLPEIPPAVTEPAQQTTNMTKYKSDFEAEVKAQAKALGSDVEAKLIELKDKTTKADITEEDI